MTGPVVAEAAFPRTSWASKRGARRVGGGSSEGGNGEMSGRVKGRRDKLKLCVEWGGAVAQRGPTLDQELGVP